MPLNLATAWEAAAEVVPDADAVVCHPVSRTWREFEDRAARLAGALGGFGIGAGDNVGLYLYNGNPYSEVTFGAFKARAAPCNVNYRYLAGELRHLLEDADAKAVFFSPELADRVDEARANLPLLRAAYKLPKSLIRAKAVQRGANGKPDYQWAKQFALESLGVD